MSDGAGRMNGVSLRGEIAGACWITRPKHRVQINTWLARPVWSGNGQDLYLARCGPGGCYATARYRPGTGRDQLQMPPDRQGQT